MRLEGMMLSDSISSLDADSNMTGGESDPSQWNTTVLMRLNDEMFARLAPVIAYFIALMLVGFVGNVVVCYMFVKKLRKSTQNFLLLCLGVFDLLSTVVGIPSEIWDMRHYYMYDSSPWACKWMRFLTSLPSIASILVLMVIAVDRYFKVCRPLHNQIQVSTAKKAIVVILVVSLVFSLPTLYIYGHRTFLSPVSGVYAHDCSVDDYFHDKSYPVIYEGILASLFVVFTAALVSLYARIWLETRRHRKYMKTHTAMGPVRMDDSIYTSSTNYDSSTDNIADNESSGGSRRTLGSTTHKKGFLQGRFRKRKRRHHRSENGGDTRSETGSKIFRQSNKQFTPRAKDIITEDSENVLVFKESQRPLYVTANTSEGTEDSKYINQMNVKLVNSSGGTVLANGQCGEPSDKHTDELSSCLKYNDVDTDHETNELATIVEGMGLNPSAVPRRQKGTLSTNLDENLVQETNIVKQFDVNSGIPNKYCSNVDTTSDDCQSEKIINGYTDAAIIQQRDKRSQDSLRPNRVSFYKYLQQMNESDHVTSDEEDDDSCRRSMLAEPPVPTDNPVRSNGSVASFASISLDAPPVKSDKLLKHARSVQSLTAKRVRRALSATRTTVIASVITLGFILSFLPHLILVILRSVMVDFEHHLNTVELILYNVFVRSYFVNNVINIFVYGSMNLEFRTQFVKLWTACRRRQRDNAEAPAAAAYFKRRNTAAVSATPDIQSYNGIAKESRC
ncbi:hypothetical protein Btru_050946 [Bulinus truncatus]|nr:hypothetical protein Btru_050946 [Bulinus truncatus]